MQCNFSFSPLSTGNLEGVTESSSAAIVAEGVAWDKYEGSVSGVMKHAIDDRGAGIRQL